MTDNPLDLIEVDSDNPTEWRRGVPIVGGRPVLGVLFDSLL